MSLSLRIAYESPAKCAGNRVLVDWVYEDAAKEMGASEATRAVAEKRTAELIEFVCRLDSLMPLDSYVTVREAERTAYYQMRQAWRKRRFQSYFL